MCYCVGNRFEDCKHVELRDILAPTHCSFSGGYLHVLSNEVACVEYLLIQRSGDVPRITLVR